MDETMADHHQGAGKKSTRQNWFFAIVNEHDQCQAVLYLVPSRTAEELTPIIARHVNPVDTVLHHDCWPSYQAIPWAQLGIAHVGHRHKLVNGTQDFSHSNAIEGLWALIKGKLEPFSGFEDEATLERWWDSAYLLVRTQLQPPG